MKNLTISACRITVCLLFIGSTNAMAEKRFNTFEMGESGHTILFEMTPEEIAEDSATKIKQENAIRAHRKKADRWVEHIEFPESGIVLEFPLNAEEIRLAKTSSQKAITEQARLSSKPEIIGFNIEIVEMGDGSTLTFSTPIGTPGNCNLSWLHKLFKANYC